tara:strand:+ start:464 stop:883 length:420 start_codon:yes stop_codon:yes gene_type:complete
MNNTRRNTINTRNLENLLVNLPERRFERILTKIIEQRKIRASELVAVLRYLPRIRSYRIASLRELTVYVTTQWQDIQRVIRIWSRPGNNRFIDITPTLKSAAFQYSVLNRTNNRKIKLVLAIMNAMIQSEPENQVHINI